MTIFCYFFPFVLCSSTFLGQPSPTAHSTPVREKRTVQGILPRCTVIHQGNYFYDTIMNPNCSHGTFTVEAFLCFTPLIYQSSSLTTLYLHVMLIMLANHQLTLYSSSCSDAIPTRPCTPPQSPSVVTECAPTTQPYLPSASTPSSPTVLRAKADLGQTLSSSHPSDCPPQVAGPLPVSAASISHAQAQPQSQPHHLPSDKGPRVLRGPSQASDETPQQLPLLNPVSALQPGSVWCR